MRILLRPSSAAALAVLALASSSVAHATERISMPFNCQFDGERVQMYPSEERSYEIYGRREHEIFTACSSADPSLCRSWQVHRFDFSCSGMRIPWIDAAAAGARALGREAWVERGSFRLVMGPMWSGERPSFGRHGWWRHRYPRDDFNADDGARVVTLPPGFAPALGIPVTFTGTPSDEIAQAPFPPATVARAPAPAAKEKIPALPERAPRKQEAPSAAAPAVAPKPGVEPAPATKIVEAATPAEDKAPAATVSNPGSVTPTLINGPGAAPQPPAPVPAARPAETWEARVAAASETAPANESAAKDPASAPAATPMETGSLPVLASYDQKTMTRVAAAAAVVLTLTTLALTGLWRWSRGPKRLPSPPTRDIASISLDGAPKGTALSLDRASAPPTLQAAPPGAASGAKPGTPADDLPMPTTYAEALQILGVGPDASLTAIKKIVDGLRQSWHPDLARSEADRHQRQRRLQQINVAWDLVSQRRTAA